MLSWRTTARRVTCGMLAMAALALAGACSSGGTPVCGQASVFLQQGRAADALALYARAGQLDEGHCASAGMSAATQQVAGAATSEAAGEAAEQAGDRAGAVARYEEAVRQDAGNTRASDALTRLGRRDPARGPSPITIALPAPSPSVWATPWPYLVATFLGVLAVGATILVRTRTERDRAVRNARDLVALDRRIADVVTAAEGLAGRAGQAESELVSSRRRIDDLERANLAGSTRALLVAQGTDAAPGTGCWTFPRGRPEVAGGRTPRIAVLTVSRRAGVDRGLVAERVVHRPPGDSAEILLAALTMAGRHPDELAATLDAGAAGPGWRRDRQTWNVRAGAVEPTRRVRLASELVGLVLREADEEPPEDTEDTDDAEPLFTVASCIGLGPDHDRSALELGEASGDAVALAADVVVGFGVTDPERMAHEVLVAPDPDGEEDVAPAEAPRRSVVRVHVTTLPHTGLRETRAPSLQGIRVEGSDGVTVGDDSTTVVAANYRIQAFTIGLDGARALLRDKSGVIADVIEAGRVTDAHLDRFVTETRAAAVDHRSRQTTRAHRVRVTTPAEVTTVGCDVVLTGDRARQTLTYDVPVRRVSVDIADILSSSRELARTFLDGLLTEGNGRGTELACALESDSRLVSLDDIGRAVRSGGARVDLSVSGLRAAGVAHVAVGERASIDLTTAVELPHGLFTTAPVRPRSVAGVMDEARRAAPDVRQDVVGEVPVANPWRNLGRGWRPVERPDDIDRGPDIGRAPGIGRF